MQQKFNEDFDLQVRSMMDQAQEPAPAGAWEAISARLDALAAAGAASSAAASSGATSAFAGLSSGARRAWYWAGAALAMAAAIALGVFFTGTSVNNSNLIDITGGPALVAETAQPAAEAQAQPAAPIAEAARPVAKVPAQPVAKVPAQPAAEVQAQPSPVEEAVQPAPAEVQAQPVAEAQPSKPATQTQNEPDPFSKMAMEDSRNASRRTPTLLTLFGGSTSNNASASKLALGGPGPYLKDGIVETSQSSFGIPVIVGLGVRFPISDVLSVGTGLDYSILTRTFTGRYTEGATVKDGDFNHILQYVGIPVDLSLKLLTKNDITLYSTVGAEAEYAISNKYRLLGTDTVVGDKVSGLQWSVGGGLGLEFDIKRNFGIFAEPSVKYYFDCGQPKSIRTDKPFQMILKVGVRFEL